MHWDTKCELHAHNKKFLRSQSARLPNSMNSSLAAHPIMYQVQVVNTVTSFSLIQPMFICLTFSMSTLHQDSSAPPLTQELYTFRTLRPKHLDIAHFPMSLLLSGILCLVKLDTFSQPLHLELWGKSMHTQWVKGSYCVLLPSRPRYVVCTAQFEENCLFFFF